MRDFDALSKLYADEYVLVRPDGSVLSKKEVLRDLQEGGLKFTSIEIANVNVRIYGQTALLTGDAHKAALIKFNEATKGVNVLITATDDGKAPKDLTSLKDR